MKTTKSYNVGRFFDRLQSAIKEEIKIIEAEEIEMAKERIEKRIRGASDKLALSLLAEYDLMRDANNIIITVRKQ